MSADLNNLGALADLLQRRCPECLDIITATSEAEYEAAIDARLERAVAHLERNRGEFKELQEDGLSAVLVGCLNGFGVSVTQQTHSNGHVDITIEVVYCTPIRRFLAEAKIYRGAAYHVAGLKQLLGRYTTGREGRGLLIVYVRDPDIQGKLTAVRAAMDRDLPFNQRGPTTDYGLRWSFASMHGHSSGVDCRVGHIGCNLNNDA